MVPTASGDRDDPGSDERALARAADLLDEVVAQVDAGELEATSPQRAYLLGAARAARLADDGHL